MMEYMNMDERFRGWVFYCDGNEMCIMDFVVADGSVVSDAHAIHFGAVSRFLILSVKQMRWSVEHGS